MLKATLVLLLSSLFIEAEQIKDFSKLKEEIQLVKKTERPKYYNKRLGGIKNPKAIEAAKQFSFNNWKTYEDEFISFKYPDSEFIKLKKEDSDYMLMIEDEIYLSLSLSKSEGFPDWYCACGRIVYLKYLFHNNSLYKLSFLKHGDFKAIEILKGGYLVFTQWTHELIPSELYLNLMLSVKLKKGTKADTKKLKELAGNSGSLSFEKGMTQNDVIKLMGKPTERTKDQLKFVKTASYEWSRNKFKETEIIDFVNGKLEFINPEWFQSEEILVKGTIDWMKAVVNGSDDDSGFGNEPKVDVPLNEKAAKYIFDRVVELAPTTTDEHGDWRSLCQVIYKLHDQGFKDQRVLTLIEKRFLETSLDQHFGAWVIHKYKSPRENELIMKRIKLELEPEFKHDSFGTNFYNYFCFMDKENPKVVTLIKEAMQHHNKDIRNDGYSFWDYLNKEDAYTFLVKGLSDKYHYIREECAEAFAESIGTREDIPLLEKQLRFEKTIKDRKEINEGVIENLEKAIKRLKEKE
jgi:hypothetical protein